MNDQPTFCYAYAGLTDAGRRRNRNEDSLFTRDDERGVWLVVADGMGGYQAGDIASQIVVETMDASLTQEPDGSSNPQARLWEAINRANQAVYEKASMDGALSGMGATVVAALRQGNSWTVANVGDSRAYLWVNGKGVRQITTDHSLVQEMVRLGQLTPEAAAVHPHRHVVTRAVGTDEMVEISAVTVELCPGDRLLLCTDGLTEHVSDAEIGRVLSRRISPEKMAGLLVRLANKRGGRDNITVAIAACQGVASS